MNRLTSDSRERLASRALRALLIAALVGCASSAMAEAETAAKRRAARQKIAAMTDAERTRLNSDFEKYSKLPDTEKEKLRQLDRALQNDADLQRTRKEYLDFLEPLSPGEREDLHRATDPSQRAALVRTMMKEHQDRAESWTRRGANRRGLNPADLEKVFGVFEEYLKSQKLTQQQATDLESKQGLARRVAIFEMAFARPTPADRTSIPSFPPQLLDDAAAAISDPVQKQRAAKGNPWERFRNLLGMTYFGLLAEFDSAKPDEEKLGEFLARLSGAQQGEILRLPVDQQQRALLRMYAESHPDEIPKLPTFPRGLFPGDRMGRRGIGGGRSGDSEGFRRPAPGTDGSPGDAPDTRRNRPSPRQKSE